VKNIQPRVKLRFRQFIFPALDSILLAIFTALLNVTFLTSTASSSTQWPLQYVRAESYFVDVQSSRSADKPRVVTVWARANYEGHEYRAQMPREVIGAADFDLQFRWSQGTFLAGQSERVEMQWRTLNGTWQSQLLGHGFRDPENGYLLLSPVHLQCAQQASSDLLLRFFITTPEGQVIQDGGNDSLTTFHVNGGRAQGVLNFEPDWKVTQEGQLIAGESFDLKYSIERIVQQIDFQSNDESLWNISAQVKFDDGPVQSYPLVAVNRENPMQVVGFIPKVYIPPSAKQVSMWFLAFHQAASFFDSNFGNNYHFAIKSR